MVPKWAPAWFPRLIERSLYLFILTISLQHSPTPLSNKIYRCTINTINSKEKAPLTKTRSQRALLLYTAMVYHLSVLVISHSLDTRRWRRRREVLIGPHGSKGGR